MWGPLIRGGEKKRSATGSRERGGLGGISTLKGATAHKGQFGRPTAKEEKRNRKNSAEKRVQNFGTDLPFLKPSLYFTWKNWRGGPLGSERFTSNGD